MVGCQIDRITERKADGGNDGGQGIGFGSVGDGRLRRRETGGWVM